MKLPFELKRTYAYDELQELVASMCRQKPIVHFSIYESFDNAEGVWMVNAPDIESTNPVILGKVRFMADYWRVTDEPLYSDVVENPTWRTIINIFNDMLQQGDGCGIFLEDLEMDEPKDGTDVVRFCIGS